KVSCLNAQTGALHWDHRFENGFKASPIICNDMVYMLDTSGVMRIFRLESTFTSIANPQVPEACVATPAFVKQKILIRGQQHLYCIGSSQP
ncbi:hypothetical protein KAR34_02280, partial [bacterium]|nr:hypothetical protein [bacterium]